MWLVMMTKIYLFRMVVIILFSITVAIIVTVVALGRGETELDQEIKDILDNHGKETNH